MPTMVLLDNDETPHHFAQVHSLREASEQVRKTCDIFNLGQSDLRKKFGTVMKDGKAIAWVSYNGRVWSADPAKLKTVDLTTEITGDKLDEAL